MFSDGPLLYFYRFRYIPCFETIFYFCFSILATNKGINIFEESEKPGGRARFRSEIPGGRARLLGRPEGRDTLLSESPGVARGGGMVNRKIERCISLGKVFSDIGVVK